MSASASLTFSASGTLTGEQASGYVPRGKPIKRRLRKRREDRPWKPVTYELAETEVEHDARAPEPPSQLRPLPGMGETNVLMLDRSIQRIEPPKIRFTRQRRLLVPAAIEAVAPLQDDEEEELLLLLLAA
jgi:hypothetical protein